MVKQRDGWNLIGVRFGRALHWAKKSLLFSAPTHGATNSPRFHAEKYFLVLFHSPLYIISLTAIILRRGLLPSGTCSEPIVSSYRYTLRVILHRGSATPILGAGSTFTAISWFFRGVSSSSSLPARTGTSRRASAVGPRPRANGRGTVRASGAAAAGKELRTARAGLVAGVQLLLEVVVLLGVVGVVRRGDAHDGGVLAEAGAIWTGTGRPAAGVHPARRQRHRRVVVTRYYAHWRGVGPTHRGIHRRA